MKLLGHLKLGNSISNSVFIFGVQTYVQTAYIRNNMSFYIIATCLICLFSLFSFLLCSSLTLTLTSFSLLFFCQFRSFLIQIYWIIITWIIWQMVFQTTIALINSQCHQFHQVSSKATAITKRQNALIKKYGIHTA